MRILAIETSCDETGLAILDCKGGSTHPNVRIIKEVVASQIKIHQPFGGVVPTLAKREHIKNLPILFKKIFGFDYALPAAQHPLGVDVIAVTVGPGLEPALWAGIVFAKELAKKWKKPLIGANHMEGHLYSPLLISTSSKYELRAHTSRSPLAAHALFPAIALIVSGGHTILLRMDSITSWKKLGETRDDAAGEAFDKVARLLDLPYPGGPEISKIAKLGEANIPFPQPMLHSKDYDFSFSGLKTAILYYLRDLDSRLPSFANGFGGARRGNDKMKANVAASFEHAAVHVLVEKTFRAVNQFGARSVWLSGGVAANKALRKALTMRAKKLAIPLIVADTKHNTDNAAMIGAAAYMSTFRKKKYPLKANGELNV